jgi:8-amino-7-oxononanoate synthase
MSAITQQVEGMHADERLGRALNRRQRQGLRRVLRVPDPACADFASNDYLGLSRSAAYLASAAAAASASSSATGSTGSRLLSGHSDAIEVLESTAAAFHKADAALLFGSGYDANLSVFSCVPQAGDVVVYDELIHASVHDGMRLGRARDSTRSFSHNSLADLRRVLHVLAAETSRVSEAIVWVAVESVYSMDGDVAPLADILRLADEVSTPPACLNVYLIVDEAHGVGIAGPRGEGVAVAQGVQGHERLFARVITYGKAFAAHGATVLGSSTLRSYLINYARPFIYATAPPPHAVATLQGAYAFFSNTEHRLADAAREALSARRGQFRRLASERLPRGALLAAGSQSPIQGVVVPGNVRCMAVCAALRAGGMDVYPIRAPTVPRGTERIRIVIHAHNTDDEVAALVEALADALRSVTLSSRARL